MVKKVIGILILMFLTGTLAAGVTEADQDIKARMKDRLPVILKLKAEGLLGEDNLGLLQFVGGEKKQEDVVAEENKDRKIVYEAIAKKQQTTPDVVGRIRSRQIAKKAKPGEWLQNEQGEWYQKK
jgi:uncharacterized protein YdbL (DUF1318 family)